MSQALPLCVVFSSLLLLQYLGEVEGGGALFSRQIISDPVKLLSLSSAGVLFSVEYRGLVVLPVFFT